MLSLSYIGWKASRLPPLLIGLPHSLIYIYEAYFVHVELFQTLARLSHVAYLRIAQTQWAKRKNRVSPTLSCMTDIVPYSSLRPHDSHQRSQITSAKGTYPVRSFYLLNRSSPGERLRSLEHVPFLFFLNSFLCDPCAVTRYFKTHYLP